MLSFFWIRNIHTILLARSMARQKLGVCSNTLNAIYFVPSNLKIRELNDIDSNQNAKFTDTFVLAQLLSN